MEITKEDLAVVDKILGMLEGIASLQYVGAVEIRATVNGEPLVFGYGESGDPAILIKDG